MRIKAAVKEKIKRKNNIFLDTILCGKAAGDRFSVVIRKGRGRKWMAVSEYQQKL